MRTWLKELATHNNRTAGQNSARAPHGRSRAFSDWKAESSGTHGKPEVAWVFAESPPADLETMTEQAHRSALSETIHIKTK